MTKPGAAFTRLAVSLRPEDERQLIELKHHLERQSGERLSMSKVIRMGIDCLRTAQGLNK